MRNRIAPFDPFNPELKNHSFEIYREYRRNAPVHWGVSPIPQHHKGCWYIFRYDDIYEGLSDNRFGREEINLGIQRLDDRAYQELRAFPELLSAWLSFRDPPAHTRIRKAFGKYFQSQAIDKLKEDISNQANHLLDQFAPGREIDIMEHFAVPLPVQVLMKMLGIPSERYEWVRNYSDFILDGLDARQSPRKLISANVAVKELLPYMKELIAARKRMPADDLITRLVNDPDVTEQLSEEDLAANLIFLIIAGHETIGSIIGNGLLALFQSPAQFELLLNDLGMLETAVPEFLRYFSPLELTLRVAHQDIEVRGNLIHKGADVAFVISSGNHDEEKFSDPDSLDIRRSPNPHFGFGRGIHYCLGAYMGLLETTIAFESLLTRFPNIQSAGSDLAWRPYTLIRGPLSLMVRL